MCEGSELQGFFKIWKWNPCFFSSVLHFLSPNKDLAAPERGRVLWDGTTFLLPFHSLGASEDWWQLSETGGLGSSFLQSRDDKRGTETELESLWVSSLWDESGLPPPCSVTGGGQGATQERKEKQLCGSSTELRSLRAPRPRSKYHWCLCCDTGGTAHNLYIAFLHFYSLIKELLILLFPRSSPAISQNCRLFETCTVFCCSYL